MGKTFSTGLLTNGIWQDSSNNIGIGGAVNASYKLTVTGTSLFTDNLSVTSTYGFTIGAVSGVARIQHGSSAANSFTFLTSGNGFANLYAGAATFSSSVIATNDTTGAAIKLTGFTNYGTIQDANDVRRIWFENTGSYRTIFDLPASGTSFDWRKNDGTTLMVVKSTGNVGIGTGSPGDRLQVAGSNNIWTGRFTGTGTSSQSYGLYVNAGTNSGDVSFLVRNATESTNYLQVRGDGKFFVVNNNNGVAVGEFNNLNSNGYGLYVGAGSGTNWALYVADYAGNAKFYANASGTLYAVNTSVQSISSDIELKTNIRDYDKGLSEVLKMKPRIYDRKDGSNDNEIGFIAQEMDIALPSSMKDGIPNKDGEVYKTYEVNWYPLLVKAIQELSAKVTALENR